MSKIVQVPINKIAAGAHALRMGGDDDGIIELAQSISRVGIIVPLVVTAEGGSYFLIAGHRRLAAARITGRSEVPCIVRDTEAAELKEISFAENLFRRDLSPLELAGSVKDCLDNKVMPVEQLAAGLHRSVEWIRKMVAMLDWPADVLEVIHNGQLSVAAASNLAMVTEDSYREFLLRNAVDSGATARTTSAWLQAWRSMQPPEAAIQAEPVPPGIAVTPAVPQAPCICCSQVFRTDQLCHIPACPNCVNVIRSIGAGGPG